jgi:glycosyltransferase involved in cell wall biosynthesis
MFLLNYLDNLSTKWVDCICANSKNLQNKIEVQLGRTSEILYPGIETSNFTYAGNENFWLSLNRLYPEKRIDLQIEAFRRLPEENLTIIGSYAEKDHASPYVKMIMQRLPGNVHVIGEVSETEVQALLSRCKGLVCTSYHEPFGIAPLEAMASGKPVVAVNEGGYLETVTSDTGVLVEPDVKHIIDGIRLIGQDPAKYKEACIERAKKFDIACFEENIRNIVSRSTKES